MRAVCISASGAGKSRTALLGTLTAQSDTILEDFVSSNHPCKFNLQPESKYKQHIRSISVQIFLSLCFFFLGKNFIFYALMKSLRRVYYKMIIDRHDARASLRSVRAS